MKKVLLFTTALSISFIQHTSLAQSACVTTPTCAELGYNASSCPNGGLKCPFGNTWNCEITNYKDKITELEKIIEELKTELKQCQTPDCEIGDYLYSDITCSSNLDSNKTVIGLVFSPERHLAVALKETRNVIWSKEAFDIPNLTNYSSETEAKNDFNGKQNTKIIFEYCQKNNKSCPAVEIVTNYTTAGTQAGDWYLPSMGELILLNQSSTHSIFGSNMGRAKGDIIFQHFFNPPVYQYTTYWTSNENNSNYAFGYAEGYSNDSKFSKLTATTTKSVDNGNSTVGLIYILTTRPIIDYSDLKAFSI